MAVNETGETVFVQKWRVAAHCDEARNSRSNTWPSQTGLNAGNLHEGLSECCAKKGKRREDAKVRRLQHRHKPGTLVVD